MEAVLQVGPLRLPDTPASFIRVRVLMYVDPTMHFWMPEMPATAIHSGFGSKSMGSPPDLNIASLSMEEHMIQAKTMLSYYHFTMPAGPDYPEIACRWIMM